MENSIRYIVIKVYKLSVQGKVLGRIWIPSMSSYVEDDKQKDVFLLCINTAGNDTNYNVWIIFPPIQKVCASHEFKRFNPRIRAEDMCTHAQNYTTYILKKKKHTA